MSYDYELVAIIPASPHEVYEAWVSSEGHTAMTLSESTIEAREGAAYRAGDGYISGRTVTLEPDRRIVQTWRTTEFADADPDSEIEVLLEPTEGGTRLTLRHRNVPDGQLQYEQGGWQDNYFEPMKRYFSGR